MALDERHDRRDEHRGSRATRPDPVTEERSDEEQARTRLPSLTPDYLDWPAQPLDLDPFGEDR